ncbi:MAG TPA: hypothetical protein VGF95_06165 [Solirubrobacteraceae bacterium]|jgi:hypothetical protein
MRLARSTGAGGGLLIVVLGLWAIFIPLLGPYFHYGFSPDASWHFTTNRLWLDILPGAAAVLGGVGLIAASRRLSGVAGGWLALAGGVWLLIGPSLSLLWGHAGAGTLQSGIGLPLGGSDRAAIEMVGFFYGPGALITALAAFAVGRFASRPGIVSEPGYSEPERLVEPVGDEPVVRRGGSRERLGRRGESAGRAPVAGEAAPREPAQRV